MSKVIIRVSGTQRIINKEAIFSFLEIIRRGIIKQQADRGIRKTGASAASLVIQELPRGGELRGDEYIQEQITGRGPGKFPPLNKIESWVQRAGLTPEGISKKSLAFLIARKIAKRGTDIFLKKKKGLDIVGIAEQYEPALRESFVKAGRIAITTAINEALNQPAMRLR